MSRISLTTGVASCVMLLPSGGCRRPSADLALPDPGEPRTDAKDPHGQSSQGACTTPKPAPGSPDDHEPPMILGARFVARDRVQLTFSEALGPVETINPRQFRLSHAYSMVDPGSGDRGYASGYYYDLAGADVYEPPLVFVKLEQYAEQPEVLALTLSSPVPVELCEMLTDAQANLDEMNNEPGPPRRGQVGLFLHYTSRGSEGVRDRVDNPLADIGADWALNFGTRNKAVYGSDPVMRLDLLPALDCPDSSLGALGGPPGPS